MARRSKSNKLGVHQQELQWSNLQVMPWSKIKDAHWKGLICQVEDCKRLAQDVVLVQYKQYKVHPLCDTHTKLAQAIILSPIKTKSGHVIDNPGCWPPIWSLAEWKARLMVGSY